MTIGASTVAQAATRSPSRRTLNVEGKDYCNKHAYYDYGRRGDYALLSKRQKTDRILTSNRSSPSFPSTPTKNVKRYNGSPCVTPKRTPGKGSCDRFIPNRSSFRMDLCRASVFCAEEEEQNINFRQLKQETHQISLATTPIRAEFQRRMRGALLSVSDADLEARTTNNVVRSQSIDVPRVNRMLTFNNEKDEMFGKVSPLMDPFQHDQLHVLDRSRPRFLTDDTMYVASRSQRKGTSGWRKIPSGPSRVLDAPDLEDDYYLNLLSWGKGNILAVALGRNVYLWDASNGDIHHLVSLEGADNYVTSVSWAEISGYTHFLGVGTHDGLVQLWDTIEMKLVRTMSGHSARVGSLAWNQHMLSSGGRDSLIIQHDVRIREHQISTYRGHLQEVCGLKWNDDGSVLASGGNENFLCLWDASMSSTRRSISNSVSPRLTLTDHKAAVKALDFCPFNRHLLASGGGTADRCIKFWNTNSGAMLNSIDTGSQVCSLLWSKHNKEICSSHGFSENQLILWSYPSMVKIQEFTGHTSRVLHMAGSSDGATIVSAAADETLRFWDIFGSPPNNRKPNVFQGSPFSHRLTTIR